jgi:hypothetical protein
MKDAFLIQDEYSTMREVYAFRQQRWASGKKGAGCITATSLALVTNAFPT